MARVVALTCGNAMVGVTGFEPAASSSRTKRATKLRHTPWQSPPGGAATQEDSRTSPPPQSVRARRWQRGDCDRAGPDVAPVGDCTVSGVAGDEGQQRRLGPAGEAHRRVGRGAEPGRDVQPGRVVRAREGRRRAVRRPATSARRPWPGRCRGRSW